MGRLCGRVVGCALLLGGCHTVRRAAPGRSDPSRFRGAIRVAAAGDRHLARRRRNWWKSDLNKAKVAAFFSVPVILLFAFHFGKEGNRALLHQGMEYLSFIILLGALYIISGGILIGGAFRGTPASNTILLAIGAVLANFIGTTGASLLLVRPLIRSNRHRRHVVHVPVFFIFVVANCGGLLTPLGDPPLFLGFLKGVPFEWTLRLFPQWIFVNGAVGDLRGLGWDGVCRALGRRDHPARGR